MATSRCSFLQFAVGALHNSLLVCCPFADDLVAIKAVDATRFRSITEIEQVQEEMAVLAQLKHPNIIRLLEVHFINNCFYFVMEYASCGSMVQYIYGQEGGCLQEDKARRLFINILAGLEYCHKRSEGTQLASVHRAICHSIF
jgi:serine/threonine protein kinase